MSPGTLYTEANPPSGPPPGAYVGPAPGAPSPVSMPASSAGPSFPDEKKLLAAQTPLPPSPPGPSFPTPISQPQPIVSPALQQQQPAPVPSMNASQRPPVQYDAHGEREWSHGLCDCCGDFGTCFVSCFCPCIVFSQNKSRFDHIVRNNGAPHPTGGETCTGDCVAYTALFMCLGMGWILQIGARSALRTRSRIRGGTCGDCCTVYCCTPCALTQESREIEEDERVYLAGQQAQAQGKGQEYAGATTAKV